MAMVVVARDRCSTSQEHDGVSRSIVEGSEQPFDCLPRLTFYKSRHALVSIATNDTFTIQHDLFLAILGHISAT